MTITMIEADEVLSYLEKGARVSVVDFQLNKVINASTLSIAQICLYISDSNCRFFIVE